MLHWRLSLAGQCHALAAEELLLNKRRWWLVVLLMPALPCAFLLFMYRMNATPPEAAPWRRDSAESVLSSAYEPHELANAQWRVVPLRDWTRPLASRRQRAWYRWVFVMPTVSLPESQSDDWAIFIDQAYSHLTFYVNGMRIGSGGPDTGLVPVLRGPLWVPVPRVLHRVSGDELLVRSDAGMRHTTLDRVHIGPAATLRPAYDHAYTMKRWLRSTSLSAMLSAAFIFGLLASLRRQESFYLWAACTVSAWTLHMVHSQFDMPPIEPALWDAYGQITLGWFVLAGTLFTHRIIDAQAPRLERAIRTWAILGAAMLCIAPAFRMATIVNVLVWLPSLLAAGVYMLVRLSKSLVTRGSHETAWFWSIAAIIFGVGAHDYITYFLWIAPGSEQFLPNTSLVLLVGLVVIVLRRFTTALSTSESLNRDLELRVAEKTQQIETHLVRTKDLERERALTAERERITRDMHDGLGGQLVAALALSRSTAQAPDEAQLMQETLEASLQELRMLIDSAEPAEGDLLTVLGMLRMRSTRRMQAAGVEFDWQVQDLPPLPDFGPHKVLQVMRIVQEALTNAMKHARASRVTIRTCVESLGDAPRVRLDVIDNGVGTGGVATAGRGLVNMHRRAAEVGGELTATDSAAGYAVTLWLPL